VRDQAAAAMTGREAPRADDREGPVERVALRGIRRTIARRLKTAVAEAALATHMDEIDVTALMERRRTQPSSAAGTFAWIVKATAQVLREHPRFNATFDEAHEELLIQPHIHVGIAVDTRDGLMVPVIRHADQKTVAEIDGEVGRLAEACRQRAIEIPALRGGTFSLSNIGALGGMFATPIPNYPEVAILATGRIVERLARTEDGAIVSHRLLPVSLSFDHRVLDGADAARFVNTLREILAEPDRLA
jgi:pyruvate dehydrogenase E2 component (dihydrolipoamide acetyltransferase)